MINKIDETDLDIFNFSILASGLLNLNMYYRETLYKCTD